MNKTRSLLSLANINSGVLKFQYAVRGPIVAMASDFQKQLLLKPHSLPFEKIYMCNVGNPQELGQPPVTFLRQVISAALYPPLLKSPLLPPDVIKRVERLLHPAGSLGAYTQSGGLEPVRRSVSLFLSQRDTKESDPDNIFLANGATQAIKRILQMLIRNKTDGVLVPIPQYPLYSATIEMFGGKMIGYKLDEENDWDIDLREVEKAYRNARKEGLNPRALCVINPGNPAGQVLLRKNIEELIDFARHHGLVILADEVYQDNIYDSRRPFVSFRKVLMELGPKFAKQELFSFDSVSKGLLGECGIRGGFAELLNVAKDVKEIYLKLASVSLCPNILGQLAVEVKTNPPLKNEESFPLYKEETDNIYQSLRRRAEKLTRELNKENGISCRRTSGALYAFPTLKLPANAVREAAKQGKEPDAFYCLELLKQTGICTVPGSGFAQREGTYHLRITILPPEKELDHVIRVFKRFHQQFMDKYE